MGEDSAHTVYLANCLRKLNGLLHEESRKAAPHSCLLYTASSQIYIIVTKLALSAQIAEISLAAAKFFQILIHSEVEGILDSKIFARAVVDLARNANSAAATQEEQDALVELLFEISTKIKLDPDILPAWFYPERDRSRVRESVNGLQRARKSQFPLFYLLVDFVHHDGATGDFARLGLLYLTETASKSNLLEQWMIESDLAPQMASGLGALYSRLSRTLVKRPKEDLPPIIALSDAGSEFYTEEESEDSQQAKKAFLMYLAFWQDTLGHCTSQEVSDTLLDHFQILFVQQLLYPSLLESSDVEGGSTASVLLHLYSILDALSAPELVDRILRYLLAAPEVLQPQLKRQRMSLSRRKSMEQLAAMVTTEAPAPDLFNLLDLIVMSLKSTNSRTVAATLKLISIIVSKHHFHVTEVLPRTATVLTSSSELKAWPVRMLTNELGKLINLALEVGDTEASVDQSYQALVNDLQSVLESHPCTVPSSIDKGPMSPQDLVLQVGNCKMVSQVFDLFETFFSNETIVNIGLTEVIIVIASCSRLSLKPWLFSAENTERSLLSLLAAHVEQVRSWKKQYPQWDQLVVVRKAELSIDPEEAAKQRSASGDTDWLEVSSTGSMPGSFPDQRTSGSQPSSRPTTPHGRTVKAEGFGSIDSKLSASPAMIIRKQRQTTTGSPLRQATTPPRNSEPAEEAANNGINTKAIDQGLLQTQVHLPYGSSDEQLAPGFASLADRLKSADPPRGNATATGSVASSGAVTPDTPGAGESQRATVSLSHVVSNAIILQEFILEIAAMIQLRASFLGEVQE